MRTVFFITYLGGYCICLVICAVLEMYCGVPAKEVHLWYVKGAFVSCGIAVIAVIVTAILFPTRGS
jgi:hypothetical protein